MIKIARIVSLTSALMVHAQSEYGIQDPEELNSHRSYNPKKMRPFVDLVREPVQSVIIAGFLIADYYVSQTNPLWDGLADADRKNERSLMMKLGPEVGRDRIRRMRRTYFGARDWWWLGQRNVLNAKVQIGYWTNPSKSRHEDTAPFVSALDELRAAYVNAYNANVRVHVQLAAHRGCQSRVAVANCVDSSINWAKEENVKDSIEWAVAIAKDAKRYVSLWAIELMYEPSTVIPLETLRSYYSSVVQQIQELELDIEIYLPVQGQRIEDIDFDDWQDFLKSLNCAKCVLSAPSFVARDTDAESEKALIEILTTRGDVIKKYSDVLSISGWGMFYKPKLRNEATKNTDVAIRLFKEQLNVYRHARNHFFHYCKQIVDSTFDMENLASWIIFEYLQ